MSAPIITVEKLSKRYLVGHRAKRERDTTLRDILSREIRNAARKTADLIHGRQIVQGDTVEEFWALKDVSFEVHEGEVLGIIGRNGAGKSTLLKILSRIIEPTSGRVTISGRVASLLEVGTGFHPELSGRENIYLNGAVLGMSRAEIRRRFDEIVDFAGVEKFLDTPVKRYSSGMYVRLAFAVAAHLQPEILIVDEVLAVGDAEFQKKCLGKMSEVARGGRTVIFVSHNMAAVQRLCTTAIALRSGSVVETSDDVRGIIEGYTASERNQLGAEWVNDGRSYMNDYFVPGFLRIYSVPPRISRSTSPEADFVVEISGDVVQSDPLLEISIAMYASDGQLLFRSCVFDPEEDEPAQLPCGRIRLWAKLPSALLNEGEYEIELTASLYCRCWVIPPGSGPRVSFNNAMVYASKFWDRHRGGVLAPKLAWNKEVVVAETLEAM